MTAWLKQSTSVSVVIGPIWATADGALKADLAYNASGINCDVYKNGTKADVTLANSAGDGYFRAASGESLYLLTLSTGHTDTLGMFTISLSATGHYMKPQHYMIVPANVWDSMFGADTLKCEVVEISGDTTAADNLEAACDNYSATRGLAGTALPDAAADDAGGLPISDAGGLDLDAIKAKTDNLPASPAAVGSAMTLADDAITAAKFDESTAFPLKSADTGATAVARTGADGDTLETISDQLDAVPTAEENADQVWDEAIAGHAGVGSTGEQLAAAGAAGDPWATAIPGAYGAGTAGKIVGDNLNATVGSRSSHDAAAVKTAIEAAGSHLALIKAKTDLGLINTTWTDAKAAYLDEAISAAKTLTAAYDDAKTAAQPGDKMDLNDAPNATALTALAVAILDTLLSEGDADALNARTIRSALRALRNKSSIAAGVLTVCKENDSDSAWTGAVTTDGAAEPITVIDPT